jgi:HAMP domain-containing protein
MIKLVQLAFVAMFLMMFTLPTLAQDQEVINFFAKDGNIILVGLVWTGVVVLFTWVSTNGKLSRNSIFSNSEALGEYIVSGGETLADFLGLLGRLDVPNADAGIESLEKAIRIMLDEMGTSADLLLIKKKEEKEL